LPRSGSREPDQRKVIEKVIKGFLAKTDLGKANYMIDAYFEGVLRNKELDEIAHLIAELNLGKGSREERLRRWAKKARKYHGR
jgi:hypothetical protein